MTFTYALMLLFVFWTLWIVATKVYKVHEREPTASKLAVMTLRLAWAFLGTFFFYSVW